MAAMHGAFLPVANPAWAAAASVEVDSTEVAEVAAVAATDDSAISILEHSIEPVQQDIDGRRK
jgi:hypothetical protein